MNKIVLILVVLFCFGLSANAQQGSGSQGALSVEYYNHGSKTGHLIFDNQTGSTISKVHIRVTVLITWTEQIDVPYLGKTDQKNKKTLVLCDDYFYNIPPNQSKVARSQRGEVKGGPEKTGKTYQYNVEVEYAVPFPGSANNSSSQSGSSSSSNNGELIMSGEICHAMYKSMDDPAPSRITVNVYKTRDGKYYANMTDPESINNMSIFKVTGTDFAYNGYIAYQNNKYLISINDSMW